MKVTTSYCVIVILLCLWTLQCLLFFSEQRPYTQSENNRNSSISVPEDVELKAKEIFSNKNLVLSPTTVKYPPPKNRSSPSAGKENPGSLEKQTPDNNRSPPSVGHQKPPPAQLSFPYTNEYYFRNPLVSQANKHYIYHQTTSRGREGTVILDMLMGHVYAFHQGAIYGGSCGAGNDVGRVPEYSLIRTIGLEDFLQFACPRDLDTSYRKSVIPGRSFVQDGTRAFTPEYMALLKSVIKYPKKQESQKKKNVIVVHMSRGRKFTPCKKFQHNGYDMYLPNKHYQLLIDKYRKKDRENQVIIFSQSESYEKFDEFRERGYELHIDEATTDVWKAVLTSDVFIMSRSSFSFVPAMVANDSTKIVYTQYWEPPIRGWDHVNKEIQEESDAEFLRLKRTC